MSQTPSELRLSADKQTLTVAFDDKSYDLSAEYLRVESPSAEVKGHGDSPKKIVPGKQGITISALEPVGHYAVQITFADGHRTGIYTWEYLYELATTHDEKWQAYLNAIFKLGFSRKPQQQKAS
jgi:DUF971 family protein